LAKTAAQFEAAGYEPYILHRPLVQSMRDATLIMEPVLQAQKGDVLVCLSTGWGLPGIADAALKRVRHLIWGGTLGVHLHSNLLPEYPGFVLASAQAHVCSSMGYPFTRDIVLDWNDLRHVERLIELREKGTISRDLRKDYGDGPTGMVTTTSADIEAAKEVLRLIDGNIYGSIGGRSMLMDQAGEDRLLMAQLGICLQDIGAYEMRAETDAIALHRAQATMQFCVDSGLKINVPESVFVRQMQLLLAMHNLIAEYSLDFLGYQGQFDMTKYETAEDMALALLNSRCRPESNGKAIVGATERDFYAAITMRLLQLCVQVRYQIDGDSVGFHDLRHIVELTIRSSDMSESTKRWFIVLLNSGALNLRDLTGRDDTMKGVRATSQNPGYFPHGGAASEGEMVHLGRIKRYPAHEGPRMGTWARLIPVGECGMVKNYKLVAGNFDIMSVTANQRLREPTLKALDQNWPLGLAATNCPWELVYGVDCNHLQSVPYDVMSLLAAIAGIHGWDFVPIGVGLANAIPQDARIVI
jgi:hypothetical protein